MTGLINRIDWARIFVSDLERSRAFYEKLFGMEPMWADEHAAVYQTGGAKLVVEKSDPDDPETPELVGRFAGLSFAAEDIDGVYKAMVAEGIQFDGPPKKQDWGGTLAHFHDPDDNVLTLIG
ncbi:MAG: VOC family protein [Pseudomonadota bacterium]